MIDVELILLERQGERWFAWSGARVCAPSAAIAGLRPGTVVRARCEFLPQQGLTLREILSTLRPGGEDLPEQLRCYLEQNRHAHARQLLDDLEPERVRSDPDLLSCLVRLDLHQGKERSAVEGLRLLLRGEVAPVAYELVELAVMLSEAARGELVDDFAAWAARADLEPDNALLACLPKGRWTDRLLLGRFREQVGAGWETYEGNEAGRRELGELLAEIQRRELGEEALISRARALLDQMEAARLQRTRMHMMFAMAMDEAPKDMHPDPPYHLGGSAPSLSASDQIRAAIWCAEQVLDRAPDDTRGEIEQLIQRARGIVDGTAPAPPDLTPPTRAATTFNVAASALTGACLLKDNPSRAASSARQAVALAVRVLTARRPGPGRLPARKDGLTARELLSGLDVTLVQLEWKALAAKRVPPEAAARLEELVWRGDDEQGKPGHYVARLSDGTFGLLTKMKRRWRWFEGSRDDILATVSDHAFEEATKQLLTTRPASSLDGEVA